MKKIIPAFLSLLVIAGCLSKEYDYQYISLEKVAGIKVVSYGRPGLAGLEADREMPVRYELSRDGYTLVFQLDTKNYWPSVFVGAKVRNGGSLAIEPVTAGNCGSFDDAGVEYRIDDLPATRYEWSPAFHQYCEVSGNESYPGRQLIVFRVENQAGEVLGEESIPFELMKNGTYREKDGL